MSTDYVYLRNRESLGIYVATIFESCGWRQSYSFCAHQFFFKLRMLNFSTLSPLNGNLIF